MTERLSNLLPLLKGIKRLTGSDTAVISGFSSDSRTVKDGDVFFALTGATQDGRRFIPMALARGATVIVSAEGYIDTAASVPAGCAFIETEDVPALMAEMAAVYYRTSEKPIQLIGVTGTNGKTTTAHIINELWKRMGRLTVFIGTTGIEIAGRRYHTDYTTPPSFEIHRILHEAWERGVRHAVMEVSSHALKLKRVDGLCYQAAVFTNLTHEHGEIHPTMEDYYQTKKRLFSMLEPQAVAVINADDDYGRRLLHELRPAVSCFDYGEQATDAKILNVAPSPDYSSQTVAVSMDGMALQFQSAIPGVYNAMNALGALLTLHRLRYPLETLLKQIPTVPPPPGRMERYEAGNFQVIIDFAHTPDGLEKLLSAVAMWKKETGKKIITVFGCPGDRDRTKRPLMGRIASAYSELTIATTDDVHHEPAEQIIADIMEGADRLRTLSVIDRREGIQKALRLAQPGDFVVIAGRGHEKYQYVGDEKVPFLDSQVAQEEAEKLGISFRRI